MFVVFFPQNNNPKHIPEASREWFEDKMDVLDWPPQLPDLNPIEHRWGHFRR